MAIFHHAIQLISRGKGKSAVASSAYRSGTKITNEYDGETHDYTKKGGIYASAILLPTHAPAEYADRSTLWNAVEQVEKAKNSQLAREIEVSIPKEIPSHLWQRMMIDYCNANFVSKGMIADLSIHNKDPNNPHCHIMLTMRPIEQDGTWGAKARKEYVLDGGGNRMKLPSGAWKSVKVNTTDWNEQTKAELWRSNWSEHCNHYLEQLGVKERIDHRSYERQGVDQIPQIHLGVAVSQMEQKGSPTERGNLNHQIIEDNKEIKIIRARITRLMKWQREIKAKPIDLEKANVRASVLDKIQTNQVVGKSRYQRIKDLKTDVNTWNFIQTHNIHTIEDFANTISDLNGSFYAIQREQRNQKAKLERLQKHIVLRQEYEQLSSNGKAKESYHKVYKTELARREELAKVLHSYAEELGTSKIRDWKREETSLVQKIALYEWKLNPLKQEIGTAEKIQKMVEEKRVREEVEKARKKPVEHTH